ncbi:MAG: alanine racemase [Gammaproteobacteria bacterium]
MIGSDALLQDLFTQIATRAHLPVPLREPVPLHAVPTPALVLDAAALDRNVARMATFLAARGKGVRPHAKTHKCPEVARRQLAAGAVGVCAAKVGEAVALVAGGVDRVLVTSPIVDDLRIALLAALSRRARAASPSAAIDVVVDRVETLHALARAVGADDALGIVIDIDVAMGRTGTRDRDTMLALADLAARTPGLIYRGVQHYAGQVMHLDGHAARRARSLALWETVAGHVAALTARGLAPGIVTGGGTGTYDIDCDQPLITDLQVGSYAFMDQQYRVIGGRDRDGRERDRFDDFEQALSVVTTVISQPRAGLVTVDGGYKAFAADAGAPEPLDLSGVQFRFAGDEHGVLLPSSDVPPAGTTKRQGGSAGDVAVVGNRLPPVGARVRFAPPHCDPTVNLYDAFWVQEDGWVRARWPISARGVSW